DFDIPPHGRGLNGSWCFVNGEVANGEVTQLRIQQLGTSMVINSYVGDPPSYSRTWMLFGHFHRAQDSDCHSYLGSIHSHWYSEHAYYRVACAQAKLRRGALADVFIEELVRRHQLGIEYV
ncbi:hypothetical protein FOZ63_011245, partial [Perkinsus olseni]